MSLNTNATRLYLALITAELVMHDDLTTDEIDVLVSAYRTPNGRLEGSRIDLSRLVARQLLAVLPTGALILPAGIDELKRRGLK